MLIKTFIIFVIFFFCHLFIQVSGTNVSPNIGNKTIKKLTALRNRSPTGESPVTKSRKPANTGKNISFNNCLINK